MTPRERMEAVLSGRPPDRTPFVPAVYEQKAFLVGETPSRIARDPALLARAVEAEYELYRADALVVGVDVYNIEAEALGAAVAFPGDAGVPSIDSGSRALRFGDDPGRLKVPDPHSGGRMPVNLEAARRLARLNETVSVRGAVSGPFSLALALTGVEEFLMGMLDDPAYCERLLAFCAEVVVAFGRAYLECGTGVIIFDSQASPGLLSPRLYEEMVLPQTRRVVAELTGSGERYCPLVIGGETTPMLDGYLATGSRQIVCDFPADFREFRRKCERLRVAVRRNIDPALVHRGPPEEVGRIAREYLEEAGGMRGFILGTGVVPFGTPAENVLAARRACVEERGAR